MLPDAAKRSKSRAQRAAPKTFVTPFLPGAGTESVWVRAKGSAGRTLAASWIWGVNALTVEAWFMRVLAREAAGSFGVWVM